MYSDESMYLLDLHKNASHHTYQAPNSELVFADARDWFRRKLLHLQQKYVSQVSINPIIENSFPIT